MVEEANNRGMTLRILGGLGIAIHCLDCRDFAVKLGRIGTGTAQGQEYSDIDLVSYGKLQVLRAQSELETILRLCFEKAA